MKRILCYFGFHSWYVSVWDAPIRCRRCGLWAQKVQRGMEKFYPTDRELNDKEPR